MLGTLKPGEYEGEEYPAVSSLVQGVVSYCGPETFLYEDEDTVAALFDNTPEGRDYWLAEASPITHASRTSAPHLIIHGAADDLVPWQPGEKYRDALRKCGARADWLLVEGGWHIIDNYDIWKDIDAFCKDIFFRQKP